LSKPINLKLDIPDHMEKMFSPMRYKVYYGGRGGSKSWGFARVLLVLALKQKMRILCTRELQRSIADSVHKLLKDQIYELGLENMYNITQYNIRGANGSEFIFCGLRSNVHEIKSIEGIDICWVEEAEKVSEESWQILIPTIRKEGSEIWISFNPDSVDDPTYKRFVLNSPEDSVIKKVSYKENPWFPETLKREMEWDKKNDYEKYLYIWEGEPRTYTDAQVFKGKYTVENFNEEEYEGKDGPYYGADWGFAVDPTVLVRCYVHDRRLYVTHEAYGVGVDIDKTPELFEMVPDSEKYTIRADSARPETISYMRKKGFKIVAAKKGPGSVEDGIAFLRGFEKIVIHERCRHTLDDFKMYSYKLDRLTGDVLPVIVDAHNNCIDALRYAIEPMIKHREITAGIPITL